jgi:hypothetical protein
MALGWKLSTSSKMKYNIMGEILALRLKIKNEI